MSTQPRAQRYKMCWEILDPHEVSMSERIRAAVEARSDNMGGHGMKLGSLIIRDLNVISISLINMHYSASNHS